MRRIHLDPGALLELPIGVSSSAWTEALARHGLAADLRGVPDDVDPQGQSPVAALRGLQRQVLSLPAVDARLQAIGLPLPFLTGRISWRALAVGNLVAVLAAGLYVARARAPLTLALPVALAAGALLLPTLRRNQEGSVAYAAARAHRAALVDQIRQTARSLANQSFCIQRGADRLVHTPAVGWLRQEEQVARLAGDRERERCLRAAREEIDQRLDAPWPAGAPSWSTEGLVPDLNMCPPGTVPMPLDKPPGDNKG